MRVCIIAQYTMVWQIEKKFPFLQSLN